MLFTYGVIVGAWGLLMRKSVTERCFSTGCITCQILECGHHTYRLLWPRGTSAWASLDEICRVVHLRAVKPDTSAWSGLTWITVAVYGTPISNRIPMTSRRSNERQHAGQEVNMASSVWLDCYATSSGSLWWTGTMTSALPYFTRSSMSTYPSSLTINLVRSKRPAWEQYTNPHKLDKPRARTKSSPLWNSTIFHTIPEWNSPHAVAAEAGSIISFKSQLASLSP